MANAVEQALLLLDDMAELRSMRRHEVFLSLKRYLAMVCLSLDPFSFSFFLIPFLTLFFSLAGYSSLSSGRGDDQLLSLTDEGGGGKAECCRGGL